MINVQNVCLFCVGLFIVDGYYDVYVWEGWMPEDDDDVRTGSGRQRWDKDRRLAMETALNYAKGLFLNNLCIICFSTGVDCHLHGKTRQLSVWAMVNETQDWQNSVGESLPLHKSVTFNKKLPLDEMEHEFPCGTHQTGKRYTGRGNFPLERPEQSCVIDVSTVIFG